MNGTTGGEQIGHTTVIGSPTAAALAGTLALLLATGHPAYADDPQNTDWPLLGNTHEMQHHADLSQINTDTVGRLGLAWWVDLPAIKGLVGNPLISDGRIFQSGAGSVIYANDLRTGEQLWTFDPRPGPGDGTFVEAMGMNFNRGVALHGELVIVGTGDCRLVAVDRETGTQRWEARACDQGNSQTITAAPRVGGGMVFTGNACGDSGMSRGHVDAFDADTGRHAWRFYTVPGDPSKPPESDLYRMAAATWGDGWYERTKGCGSVWDAMVYDPGSERLYIGVGGPSPLDPTARGANAGDELFTNSVVALDAKTGEYVWHFKQNPGDGWNFEPAVGLMLASLPDVDGERRVVVSVPKDGFVYVLDADTGEFLSGRNYVPVNWASGLDEEGRPIYLPDARYWEQPDGRAVVSPAGMGAHSWDALAFDPEKHVVFIPVQTMPTLHQVPTDAEGLTAELGVVVDAHYGSKGHAGWEAFGELVAWDPVLQTEVWRQRHALPMNGGALHTAGGLVFQGLAEGYLVAYDSATGERLWSAPAGGTVRSAPSTVMADGKQYIVVASGNIATAGPGSAFSDYSSVPRARSRPRLLAFALDGSAPAPPWAESPHIPAPPAPRLDATLAAAGEGLFEAYGCMTCHGTGAVALVGALDLRIRPPASVEYLQTVLGGALAARGMPAFELADEGAAALRAYLVNLAWDAHEAQDGGSGD